MKKYTSISRSLKYFNFFLVVVKETSTITEKTESVLSPIVFLSVFPCLASRVAANSENDNSQTYYTCKFVLIAYKTCCASINRETWLREGSTYRTR